jgi:hypothetical protein
MVMKDFLEILLLLTHARPHPTPSRGALETLLAAFSRGFCAPRSAKGSRESEGLHSGLNHAADGIGAL